MSHTILNMLRTAAAAAESRRTRLVLLVGPARSGKSALLQQLATEQHWPLLSVGAELSRALLEVAPRRRPLEMLPLMTRLLRSAAPSTGVPVLLDNTELLFAPELAQNPLHLLGILSRNRTVIAAWSGRVDAAQRLVYAEPGHAEYRLYDHADALLVPVTQPTA